MRSLGAAALGVVTWACFGAGQLLEGQQRLEDESHVRPAPTEENLRVALIPSGAVQEDSERHLTVQVVDRNDRPVEGAEVVVRLPIRGASATFQDGKSSLVVKTDQNGQAALPDWKPNNTTGKFDVHVTASYGNQTGETSISISTAGHEAPSKGASGGNADGAKASILPKIQLPVEVIGPDGKTVTVTFDVSPDVGPAGPLDLYMQIHGLRYQTEASVQVNGAGWQPINENSVTLMGRANAYGGIGGGFRTLGMTMRLFPGIVRAGRNTLAFRFNGTDGRVSGFRVLAFNVQNTAGDRLIPSSEFVNEDPNTWKPPSTKPSDINTGKALWHQAALTVPTAKGAQPIQAHCADCHTQDGRDLKYFNYSNNSIRTRSLFHGLNAEQGDQIASYIRSLKAPNPGRPWNPPYQPGPGLDAQPVENWAAGAGIDAVLNSDQELMNELLPTGAPGNLFSPKGFLNIHETAIPLQLPDWNSWLPTIHPMDAWSDFLGSSAYQTYLDIRSKLKPGDASVYASTTSEFDDWNGKYLKYIVSKTSNLNDGAWTPTYVNQVYSTGLWTMVKDWELNQEFGLEGMARSVFKHPKADARAWYSRHAFWAAPHLLRIPSESGGVDNGRVETFLYVTMVWWQVQLVLNNSEYQEGENSPIDWAYAYGWLANDFSKGTSGPQAGLFSLWMAKGLQISNNGVGPDHYPTGWSWTVADISLQVSPGLGNIWVGTPAATRRAIGTAVVRAWLEEVQQFTPQQFWNAWWSKFQTKMNASGIPTPGRPGSLDFVDRVWYMIPQFRYLGVDQRLIDQMATWAETIWPKGNWAATTTATCAPVSGFPGLARCSTEQ